MELAPPPNLKEEQEMLMHEIFHFSFSNIFREIVDKVRIADLHRSYILCACTNKSFVSCRKQTAPR